MAIPVPHYLKDITKTINSDKNKITLSVVCTCNNDSFILYENYLSGDHQEEIDKWENQFKSKIGHASYYAKSDKDGNVGWYKTSWFGLKNTKIELGPPPARGKFVIIKAVCNKCSKEHIIFDERFFGYDGVMTDIYHKYKDDVNYFRKIKSLVLIDEYRVEINVENDASLDTFNESVGEEVDETKYSNSFGRIKIKVVDKKTNKNRTILDLETA